MPFHYILGLEVGVFDVEWWLDGGERKQKIIPYIKEIPRIRLDLLVLTCKRSYPRPACFLLASSFLFASLPSHSLRFQIIICAFHRVFACLHTCSLAFLSTFPGERVVLMPLCYCVAFDFLGSSLIHLQTSHILCLDCVGAKAERRRCPCEDNKRCTRHVCRSLLRLSCVHLKLLDLLAAPPFLG